jgi:hypothetical protein
MGKRSLRKRGAAPAAFTGQERKVLQLISAKAGQISAEGLTRRLTRLLDEANSILAAGSTEWVKLWNVTTREELASFPSHNFTLMVGMAFARDGNTFAYP